MEQFECVMELFDLQVKNFVKSSKIRYFFAIPPDIETEKKLLHFRKHSVKASITREQEPARNKDIVNIEDSFEVYNLKWSGSQNGEKFFLVMDQIYTKDKEIEGARLRKDNCKIFLEKLQKELDLEDDEVREEYEA